jgi:hypothetical protein
MVSRLLAQVFALYKNIRKRKHVSLTGFTVWSRSNCTIAAAANYLKKIAAAAYYFIKKKQKRTSTTKGDRDCKPRQKNSAPPGNKKARRIIPVGFHSIRSSFPESSISSRRYVRPNPSPRLLLPPKNCLCLCFSPNYWIIVRSFYLSFPQQFRTSSASLLRRAPLYWRWTAVGGGDPSSLDLFLRLSVSEP